MIAYRKNSNIGTDSTYLRTCHLLGDQKVNNTKNSYILLSIWQNITNVLIKNYYNNIPTTSKVNLVHINNNKVKGNNSHV